jgi:hypothetical protein
MTTFQHRGVAAKFAAYPPDVRRKLLALRELVLRTATATPGVGQIEEALKWGEWTGRRATPNTTPCTFTVGRVLSRPCVPCSRMTSSFKATQWDVHGLVAQGKLVRLLPDWHFDSADIVALVPHRPGNTFRVQAFVKHLQRVIAGIASAHPCSVYRPSVTNARLRARRWFFRRCQHALWSARPCRFRRLLR